MFFNLHKAYVSKTLSFSDINTISFVVLTHFFRKYADHNVYLFKQPFNIEFVCSMTCLVMQNWSVFNLHGACMSKTLSFYYTNTNLFVFLTYCIILFQQFANHIVYLFTQSFIVGFFGSMTCLVMQNWSVFNLHKDYKNKTLSFLKINKKF